MTSEQKIDSTDIEVHINKIVEVLNSHYVYPEKAKKMGDNLLNHLKNNSYEGITNNEDLANLLIEHLYEIVIDKHVRVLARNKKSENYFAMADEIEKMMEGDGCNKIDVKHPEKTIQMKSNVKIMRKSPGKSNEKIKIMKMSHGKSNEKVKVMRMPQGTMESGIEEVKILDNNIGYLSISMLNSYDIDKMSESLATLASTQSLIIDLRKCKGGEGSMVHFVHNYLFGVEENDEPILIIEHYFRPDDMTLKTFAKPYENGENYRGKPVYVLTSKMTGSAAEAMTFGLKNHKRAKIIGETTGGAGHPTSFHKLSEDLLFMCSIGRAYDPKTNKGWETIGIKPDIEVSKYKALDKAIELIFQNFIV